MDTNSKPALNIELCNEVMEKRREQLEQSLREMFDKYGVPEEEGFAIANSFIGYFKEALNESHGVSPEDETATAVDKARMAAGYIALEKIIKMSMKNQMKKKDNASGGLE